MNVKVAQVASNSLTTRTIIAIKWWSPFGSRRQLTSSQSGHFQLPALNSWPPVGRRTCSTSSPESQPSVSQLKLQIAPKCSKRWTRATLIEFADAIGGLANGCSACASRRWLIEARQPQVSALFVASKDFIAQFVCGWQLLRSRSE